MEIDSIGDFSSLTEWLESEEAGNVQRHLEEKIIHLLFSYDYESTSFKRMAAQLAWIGSRAETKFLLEKEIITLDLSKEGSIESCGLWKKTKKACSKVVDFVADHAVEIFVGAALCATGAGLVGIAGYTFNAAVGGVIVLGAGSILQSEEPVEARPPLPDPKACSKEEFAALQNSLGISLPKIELPSSLNELLVTANGIWAGGQFFSTESLMKHSLFSSVVTQNADWKTFTYSTYLASQLNKTCSYQTQGEIALVLGDYKQAFHDLEKAIEATPHNSICYLERSVAYFGLGEYATALKGYQDFAATQEPPPKSVCRFSMGFVKGLPKGIYESGEGLLLFLADFVKNPIHASKQVIDAITTLIDLVHKDEWGLIAETLSPEIHELVTQWNTIPPIKRGELAGYAIGKHGADILFPGALAKIASKSAQAAQELAAVCKNLKLAQETLLLEIALDTGSPIKIAEIIREGQIMMALGEEVGLTAQEMRQLKQAGKLQSVINSGLEKLVSQSESDVFKAAIGQNKHVKMVRDYLDKPTKEIQKGINSYEKQIVIHKDKIANPTKYYPDWDKLDPRQREALINKKWPIEIQGYEEQKNVLQSILNERLSYE